MAQYRITRNEEVLAEGALPNLLKAISRAVEIKTEDRGSGQEYAIDQLIESQWHRAVTLHPVVGA